MIRLLTKLQHSQLSVQALSRLSSVVLFLLASWTDTARLPLVALQGILLALPFTLMESLIGRPISAGLLPATWDVESWARRASAATLIPVAVIAGVSATVALPAASWGDRLLMLTPVLLQLPLEAMFWAQARTRSTSRANLIPQLVAIGTMVCGGAFALAGIRVDVAAVPGQLAVLAWLLLHRRVAAGTVRPGYVASLRAGATYFVTASVDLAYSVALPSVAGALAGPAAVVVLRALELAFGPFHVLLSATTREDVVLGRRSRLVNPLRLLTVAGWVAVSVVVTASPWVRGLLATDLRDLALITVATFCAYKGLLMFATWMSVRHMIWAAPRRYLVSGVGSRVIALGALAASVTWVHRVPDLLLSLLISEALVVAWFAYRIARTPATAADQLPASV
ncbi:hypothetical protein [Actinoplanes palleronii]|uniref:O-antigen/teichoic acid export membrane protein n=1 Tax=Actinoplanes palleronii TaxID=113570 RepID=A0ABQ4B291_9ACTN|nr:hypothetical protein [Actinoplanes palleronii]GIE64778.1 hypothetical protein Apa02nite_008860 [Actinoplanes palleronii]